MGKPNSEFVHSVFENIAGKYDFMNSLISFRRHKAWRKFAMKQMQVKKNDSALDVCCGTCDWTISLARASEKGRIDGLDFSQAMLGVGQQKIDKLHLHNQIQLHHGNAMQLPFSDNTFDHATIGFGIRNVPDMNQVFTEMLRVVKPGGQVVCLELSKPTWPPFRLVYYVYFQQILPAFGKIFANKYEQYRWLPESLKSFPGYEELKERLQHLGMVDVQAFPLSGGIAALHIGKKQQ